MNIKIEFNKEENLGYIKTIQEELQKRFETQSHNVIIEDNPVPLLDSDDIYFLEKLLRQSVPLGTKFVFTNQSKILSKLKQNGVETNKSEPILCDVCKLKPAITFKGVCEKCHPHV